MNFRIADLNQKRNEDFDILLPSTTSMSESDGVSSGGTGAQRVAKRPSRPL
jgi:hypothetical protein